MHKWMSILDFKLKNQIGFTLLEVLIAITVLSFIILGIATITDDSQQTAESVIQEDLDLLQVDKVVVHMILFDGPSLCLF